MIGNRRKKRRLSLESLERREPLDGTGALVTPPLLDSASQVGALISKAAPEMNLASPTEDPPHPVCPPDFDLLGVVTDTATPLIANRKDVDLDSRPICPPDLNQLNPITVPPAAPIETRTMAALVPKSFDARTTGIGSRLAMELASGKSAAPRVAGDTTTTGQMFVSTTDRDRAFVLPVPMAEVPSPSRGRLSQAEKSSKISASLFANPLDGVGKAWTAIRGIGE